MSAHTPGPWTADTDIDVDGEQVFAIWGDGTIIAQVDKAPDADLIAAAPDLLDAAKEIEALVAAHVYPQPDKPDSKWAKLVRLREAIAKAEPE